MPVHSFKEVTMASTAIDKVVISGLILIVLALTAVVSCDKRHGVSTPGDPGNTSRDVGNIVVMLTPNQIRLASPEAIDSVLVNIAVLDSSGVGLSGIPVTVTRSPQIGYITQPDSTNFQGRTSALFIAEQGVYDSTRITVHAGDKSRSAVLFISGPSAYNLTLNYSPPTPKLIDHEADPYTVTATLVDTTQRGVGGQPVTFAILNQVGRIGFADTFTTVPRTNSQGMVEALFYNTQVDEVQNPEYADIQVVTTPPDGQGFIAAAVTIPLRTVRNTLTLEATPDIVIGDGTSHTSIRAFLLDSDGHGIVGDTIRFSSVGMDGSVQALRTTDDNGIATSIFTPFGGVDNPDTSTIRAEYRPGSIHSATSSVNVVIMPVRSIGYITASLQKQSVVADGVDSSSIFITVQDSTGSLIADGTTIYLENSGIGFLSSPQVTTVAGQARAKITSPNNIVGPPNVRIDTITVRGNLNDSVFITDQVVVNYIPGPIRQLQFIRPESTIALIAGSGTIETVMVEAIDANGNPVANGTQIRFRNEIPTSSLTPEAAPTSDGIATSIYLVGSGTGDDNVIAFVPNPTNPNDTIRTLQPVVFRCLSSIATTLRLDAANSNIQVGGASTQIIATLQDAYGNPLSEGYVVAFDITVSPGVDEIEKPSFDTQPGVYHDTVATNINGQAIVQLYSGRKAGAVSIRACTIPLPPDSLNVCDEKSLVTISSGPPAWIDVSFSFVGEASNPNTPERFCQVGAVVGDRFANPVEYGTAVYFTLLPSNLADIEGNSYTGGARPYHPDSVNGVAYTRIIYGCFSTFDFIRVIAHSAGDSVDVVDTSVSFTLPIFEGAIGVSANPGNLWCTGSSCSNTASAAITAVLVDGGGCPIEGGILNFSALVAGQITGQSQDTTDITGAARTTYTIRGCEIPLRPDGQATIETTVKAVLQQNQQVEGAVNIVCSRPPGL